MDKEEDIPMPSPEDLDFIADVGVNPHARSPEQGIADMNRHLEMLRKERDSFAEDGSATAQELVAQLDKEIRDTQLRLAEYQAQKDGRN